MLASVFEKKIIYNIDAKRLIAITCKKNAKKFSETIISKKGATAQTVLERKSHLGCTVYSQCFHISEKSLMIFVHESTE